jgi:hypothetical protein
LKYTKSEFTLNCINEKISSLEPKYYIEDFTKKRKHSIKKKIYPPEYHIENNILCWDLLKIFDVFLCASPYFSIYE